MLYLPFALLLYMADGSNQVSLTPSDIARAIGAFTDKPVSAGDVRQVVCRGIEEEPTEAECNWQWKRDGRWRRYASYVAIDGRGWVLIDGISPVQ